MQCCRAVLPIPLKTPYAAQLPRRPLASFSSYFCFKYNRLRIITATLQEWARPRQRNKLQQRSGRLEAARKTGLRTEGCAGSSRSCFRQAAARGFRAIRPREQLELGLEIALQELAHGFARRDAGVEDTAHRAGDRHFHALLAGEPV